MREKSILIYPNLSIKTIANQRPQPLIDPSAHALPPSHVGNRTIPKTYKPLRISLLLIRSFFFPSFSFLLLFPLSFIPLVYFPFLVLPSFLRLFLALSLFYSFTFTPSLIYAILFTQFSTIFRSPHLFGKFFLPSFLRLFSRIFRLRNFLDFFLYSPLLLFFIFSLFYFLRPLLRLSFTPSYIHFSLILLFTPSYLYSSSIPFVSSPLFYAPFRVSYPYFCAIIS